MNHFREKISSEFSLVVINSKVDEKIYDAFREVVFSKSREKGKIKEGLEEAMVDFITKHSRE